VPKIKLFIQQSWLLLVCSFVFGLLMAAANAAWQDRISYNQNVVKFNNIAREIFPKASDFISAIDNVELDLGKSGKATTSVKKAVDSSGGVFGWTFVCQGSGFADVVRLVMGVDADFKKIVGYGVLQSSETPGFGDQIKQPYYRQQFVDAPAGELVLSKIGDAKKIDSEIVAISGATISSQAVVDMINKSLPQVKKAMKEKGLISDGK
jgi:Na+-translocating ferredoxin:NAD+ oxidoreductase subunit G